MKCVICKTGDTQAGHTTVTLERNQAMLVYKEVPAEVCDNCGEAFVGESVAQRLLRDAEAAAAAGAELEVVRYQAA